MDWRQQYTQAYVNWFSQEYPLAYKDHGVPATKFPPVAKANGLTRAIKSHLNWSGHYANRINVAGRLTEGVEKQESGTILKVKKWIPSTTNKGSSDISCIVRNNDGLPVPVSIEIKIGKDRMSEDQKKEQKRIERAGGVYLVIKTIEQYFEWYNEFTGYKN